MKKDLVVEILTDLIMEEAEATTPHADTAVIQAAQKGAIAAGRIAGLEAKAAGLDRNGVRFAVSQAVRNHTERWRELRKSAPIKPPEKPVEDHEQRIAGVEKTVQKLQTDKTKSDLKHKVELAKVKADAKVEAIRLRTAQRVQKITARRAGKGRGK